MENNKRLLTVMLLAIFVALAFLILSNNYDQNGKNYVGAAGGNCQTECTKYCKSQNANLVCTSYIGSSKGCSSFICEFR